MESRSATAMSYPWEVIRPTHGIHSSRVDHYGHLNAPHDPRIRSQTEACASAGARTYDPTTGRLLRLGLGDYEEGAPETRSALGQPSFRAWSTDARSPAPTM